MINELSLVPASLFKIPHHGSETAYHEKTWQNLLTEFPLSMTTPYIRSSLPTSDNINKLQELSSQLFITRDPKAHKKIKRENMVERELKSIVKDRKTINDKMGHIQIRITQNGQLSLSGNQHVVQYCNPYIARETSGI